MQLNQLSCCLNPKTYSNRLSTYFLTAYKWHDSTTKLGTNLQHWIEFPPVIHVCWTLTVKQEARHSSTTTSTTATHTRIAAAQTWTLSCLFLAAWSEPQTLVPRERDIQSSGGSISEGLCHKDTSQHNTSLTIPIKLWPIREKILEDTVKKYSLKAVVDYNNNLHIA